MSPKRFGIVIAVCDEHCQHYALFSFQHLQSCMTESSESLLHTPCSTWKKNPLRTWCGSLYLPNVEWFRWDSNPHLQIVGLTKKLQSVAFFIKSKGFPTHEVYTNLIVRARNGHPALDAFRFIRRRNLETVTDSYRDKSSVEWVWGQHPSCQAHNPPKIPSNPKNAPIYVQI